MTRLLITIIALIIGLFIFTVNVEENKIYDLEQEIQQYKSITDTDRDIIDYQRVRIDELIGANETLIKYSEPKSCIKAIQHTKLPAIIKVK